MGEEDLQLKKPFPVTWIVFFNPFVLMQNGPKKRKLELSFLYKSFIISLNLLPNPILN